MRSQIGRLRYLLYDFTYSHNLFGNLLVCYGLPLKPVFYVIDNLNYYSTYYLLVNATALTTTTPTTSKTLITFTGTVVAQYAKHALTMVDTIFSKTTVSST